MRLIDADAVFPWYVEAFKGKIKPNEIRFSMNDIAGNLDNIPTIKPERKRGEWIHKVCGFFECDQCGELVSTNVYIAEKASDRFKFCPNCGAQMEEGGE